MEYTPEEDAYGNRMLNEKAQALFDKGELSEEHLNNIKSKYPLI